MIWLKERLKYSLRTTERHSVGKLGYTIVVAALRLFQITAKARPPSNKFQGSRSETTFIFSDHDRWTLIIYKWNKKSYWKVIAPFCFKIRTCELVIAEKICFIITCSIFKNLIGLEIVLNTAFCSYKNNTCFNWSRLEANKTFFLSFLHLSVVVFVSLSLFVSLFLSKTF